MNRLGDERTRAAQLELILAQLPAAVWTTDKELRLESVTGAVLEDLETAVVERIGDTVTGKLATESGAMVEAHRRALVGEVNSLEVRVGERVFAIRVAPRQEANDEIVGCLGVAFEITPRVRAEEGLQRTREELEERVDERTQETQQALDELGVAEEELRQRHEELRVAEEELREQHQTLLDSRRELEEERRRYQALFEFAPDGYLVTDPEGVIEEANRAAGELFARPGDYLKGKPLAVLVSPPDRARLQSVLAEADGDAGNGRRLEMALEFLRNGEVFHASLVAAPEFDSRGGLTSWRWLVRDVTERVRTAQERERLAAEIDGANQMLTHLLDRMPVGVVICDQDGQLLLTNRRGEEILGTAITGDVLHPERAYTPFYPDGSPFPSEAMPLVRAMRDGEVVAEEEILVRRHDGEEVIILAGAAPVRDDAGEIVRGVTVFQDITARKADERRIHDLLAESEEQRAQAQTLTAMLQEEWDLVRTIMENTDTHLAYLDPDFNFVRVNSAYAAGAGYSPEELLHKNHFELFPHEENQAIFERVRDMGEPAYFRAKPFEFPDESQRGVTYWDWSLVPAKDENGEVKGLVFSLAEVTEREKLLAENRRQREFLEHLIDAAPVGIAVVRGPEHRYDLVNRHYREIPGFDAGPMVGRTLAEIFPDPSVSEAGAEMLNRVYREDRIVGMREYRASVGAGREETFWNFDMVPLHDSGGGVDGVLIITSEITDQVRSRQLAEAQAARDEAVLTSMADGLIVFDAQGEIVEINPAAMRIHRLERPSGGPWTIESVFRDLVMRDSDGELLSKAYWPTDRIRAGEVFAGYEVQIQHRRGDHSWVGSYSGTAVLDQNGEFALGVLTVRDVTAQKDAETEREWLLARLEGERARLETIFEQAPEGIVVADREARILMTNPAADQLYARPVPFGESYENQAALQLLRADGTPYDPRALPLTCSALDGVTVREEEMAILWPDGQRRDLLVNSAPIRDKDGEIYGAVGVFQDITERKETQQRLQRLTTRLEALRELDRAILSARGAREIADVTLPFVARLVPCQRASVALFDVERDRSQLVAVHVQGDTRLQTGWQSGVEGVWPTDSLAQGRVHIEKSPSLATPLMGALQAEGVKALASVPLIVQGRLIGSLDVGTNNLEGPSPEEIGVLREVADHLAIGIQQAHLYSEVEEYAEQLERMVARRTARLRISEARFRTVFDGAAIGIALLDRGGQIMETNPALQRMVGYDAEALRERSLLEFIEAGDLDDHGASLFADLMAGQQEAYQAEVRYRGPEGRTSWGNLAASAVSDAEGQPRFLIAMLEDSTERKEAQEALLRTEKLAVTGKLAASMVHEINNPLQAVVGCLALADETLHEGGDVSEYLQIAREELRRTAGIVDQLRDVHRRSQPREKRRTNVDALLEQVLALNRERLERQGIKVVWDRAREPLMVPLVADRIQQVFLNLTLNAADAMVNGGELHVKVADTDEPAGVTISFADTGMGIPEEVMDSLFEPFFSTKEEGVGLGLYITRNIVEQHGGQITVESTAGKGTRFEVWLPDR